MNQVVRQPEVAFPPNPMATRGGAGLNGCCRNAISTCLALCFEKFHLHVFVSISYHFSISGDLEILEHHHDRQEDGSIRCHPTGTGTTT